MSTHACCGAGVSNISVRGGGTIRGPGPFYWNCNETTHPGCHNHGYLIKLSQCTDVVFEDLTVTMAPVRACHNAWFQLRVVVIKR